MVVSMCCNDERGAFSGFVTSVHLGNGVLDLESRHIQGATFRDSGQYVRISRRKFPVSACRECYGNLFWNGYQMKDRDVVKLLVYLKESGKWTCDGGLVVFCDWWDRDTGYSEADWLIAEFRKAREEAGAVPAVASKV